MPQIIVAADRGAGFGDGAVTFRERVNIADFESEHFTAQLVERLGWAVEDADGLERPSDARDSFREDPEDIADNGDEIADEPDRARDQVVAYSSA